MMFLDEIEVHRGLISAWRYLAFLEAERRSLLNEIMPEWDRGGYVIPMDDEVMKLHWQGDPMVRAPSMLRAAGLDPYADATGWIGLVGARFEPKKQL